ncbi:MAG: cobalamin-dependent protein [Vicinamibacteria bacterium]|nr:cobalamin-dependent protein [Vicinamibacteria bacterium]
MSVVIARRIRDQAQVLADDAARRFFGDNPDCEGWRDCEATFLAEESRQHLAFLAGAIELSREAAFASYVRWAARVLESRSIPRSCLAGILRATEAALLEHLSPAEFASVAPAVGAGLAALAVEPESMPAEQAASAAIDAFVLACLRGERGAASTLLADAVHRGGSLIEAYASVVDPALREIGRLWEVNQITVADEHTATAVAQVAMARLHANLAPPEPHRGRAVVTGVEGELHQLGALMVADVLEMDGWDVRFLGTGTPLRDVVSAARGHSPNLVAISAMTLMTAPSVRRLVTELRASLAAAPRIIVGGGAFRHDRTLWRTVGADAFGEDLPGALQAATPQNP